MDTTSSYVSYNLNFCKTGLTEVINKSRKLERLNNFINYIPVKIKFKSMALWSNKRFPILLNVKR